MSHTPFNYSKNIFFLIFVLSGFSGLIYESIWTHYLKLFLGHAAYAQTLVLGIFMGGMAIGAWICSKNSTRWKNQLLAYAIIEGIIGAAALLFHPSFDGIINLSYSAIMPGINSSGLVTTYKWLVSALMILPQSILLGMTFPLMSAGLIRRFPVNPGSTMSMLYFTNSLGAAAGVLTSGFLFIAWFGLPGTIAIAGMINIALAFTVWTLIKNQTEPAPSEQSASGTSQKSSAESSPSYLYKLFLGVAFVTGAASFIYEVSWIRMLNLVLSSSTHAFELMLSAFILGLALGSLWIRKRIDSLGNTIYTLAIVQLVMGVLALLTLPIYNQTFDLMQWLLQSIDRDPSGYFIFNISSHLIAGAVMLPTTFCAGMTLPLITYKLIKSGHGEKSIGAVYAFNTLGAIAGVVFTIHIGLPILGLKGSMLFGAALDILLALILAFMLFKTSKVPLIKTASVIAIVSVTSVALLVELDPFKMASGVYRHGHLFTPDSTEILYHKDGKSASIDLIRNIKSGNVTISTNGKPDATVNMSNVGPASPDEATMILAGAIPLALHPSATTAGVIGLGSGLSTQTLLAANTIQSVDTVEIESAIVEAAHGFRPKVELVYTSPKSAIYIDDAKTYFSTFNKKYDIIVSEPSNPWVSGTASLFTKEFYKLIKNHLNQDGMLVQWLQLYEIDLNLIASVAKALSEQFKDYIIYATDDEDIVFIAKADSHFNEPSNRIFFSPWIQQELRNIGVRHLQDLQLHVIGDKTSLAPLFNTYPISTNSDYYPVLDLGASRTRFFQSHAGELVRLNSSVIPATKLLSRHKAIDPSYTHITPNPYLKVSDQVFAATLLRDYVLSGRIDRQYSRIAQDVRFATEYVRNIFFQCQDANNPSWLQHLLAFSNATLPFLNSWELDRIWSSFKNTPCYSLHTNDKILWIGLLHAVSTGKAQDMVLYANKILGLSKEIDNTTREYVALVKLIGLVKLDNKAEAQKTWNTFANLFDIENNLLHRLVYGHTL